MVLCSASHGVVLSCVMLCGIVSRCRFVRCTAEWGGVLLYCVCCMMWYDVVYRYGVLWYVVVGFGVSSLVVVGCGVLCVDVVG